MNPGYEGLPCGAQPNLILFSSRQALSDCFPVFLGMALEEVEAQMMPLEEMCPEAREAHHGLPQPLEASPLVTVAPAWLLPARNVGMRGCSWTWSSGSAGAMWALLVVAPRRSCDN